MKQTFRLLFTTVYWFIPPTPLIPPMTLSRNIRVALLSGAIGAGLAAAFFALPQSGPTPAAQAAESAKGLTLYECQWAAGPIKLDGLANEEAWKSAPVIDHFYLPWMRTQARPALTSTKAKLLWDNDYLYFHADMEDHDLYADVTEHNGVTWNNDVFELFFKPSKDKLGYYEFQVNAANTSMELYLPSRGSGGYGRWKNVFKMGLESKVALRGTLNDWKDRDEGWSVEGRIPWSGFAPTGGKPEAGAEWKFTLCRYDYSTDLEGTELSTCSPLQQLSFHQYEDYSTIRFVGAKK